MEINNTFVTLDARGEKIKIYRSLLTLSNSTFFKGILGETGYKTTPQEDGSYFIDCDKITLENILSYIETGHARDDQINPQYLMKMFEKFDLFVETETETETEILTYKQERKNFFKEVLQALQKMIDARNDDAFEILFEFYNSDGDKFIQKGNTICILCGFKMFGDLANALDSEMIRNEMFKDVKKENYSIDISVIARTSGVRKKGFKFTFTKIGGDPVNVNQSHPLGYRN